MEDHTTANAELDGHMPPFSVANNGSAHENEASPAADAPSTSVLPPPIKSALGNIPSLSGFPGIKLAPVESSEGKVSQNPSLAPKAGTAVTLGETAGITSYPPYLTDDVSPDATSILKALLKESNVMDYVAPKEPSPKPQPPAPPSPPSVPVARLAFLSKPPPDPEEEEQHQKDSIVRLFKAAAFSSFSAPDSIPVSAAPPPPAKTFAVAAANAALASLKAASSGNTATSDQEPPPVSGAARYPAPRTLASHGSPPKGDPFSTPKPSPAPERAAFVPTSTGPPPIPAPNAVSRATGAAPVPDLRPPPASAATPSPSVFALAPLTSAAPSQLPPHVEPATSLPKQPAPALTAASDPEPELSPESVQLADLHVLLQREVLLEAWSPLLALGVHSLLDLCYVEPADVDAMPLTDDLKARLWSLVERQQTEMPLADAVADDDTTDDNSGGNSAAGGGLLSGFLSGLVGGGSVPVPKSLGPDSKGDGAQHVAVYGNTGVAGPDASPTQGGGRHVSPGDSPSAPESAGSVFGPSGIGAASILGVEASISVAGSVGGATTAPGASGGGLQGAPVEEEDDEEKALAFASINDSLAQLSAMLSNRENTLWMGTAGGDAASTNEDEDEHAGDTNSGATPVGGSSVTASPTLRGSASAAIASASPYASAVAGLASVIEPQGFSALAGGKGAGASPGVSPHDGGKSASITPPVGASPPGGLASKPPSECLASKPPSEYGSSSGISAVAAVVPSGDDRDPVALDSATTTLGTDMVTDEAGVAGGEPPPLVLSPPATNLDDLDDTAGVLSVADALKSLGGLLSSPALSDQRGAAVLQRSPAPVPRHSPVAGASAAMSPPPVSSSAAAIAAVAAAAVTSASISAGPASTRPAGLAALRGKSADASAYKWGSKVAAMTAAAAAAPPVSQPPPEGPREEDSAGTESLTSLLASFPKPAGVVPPEPVAKPPPRAVVSRAVADESGLPASWLGLGVDATSGLSGAGPGQAGSSQGIAFVPLEEEDEGDDALWGLVDTLAAQVDRLAMSIGLVEKEFRGRVASTMPAGKAQQTMLALEIYTRAAPMGSAGSLCVEGATSAKRTGASSAKNTANTMKDVYKRFKQQHPYVPALIASWTLVHANPSLVDNSEVELRQLQAEINSATATATAGSGPSQTAAFYTGAMQALGLRLLAEGQERQLAASGVQSITEGGRQEEWRSRWADGGDHDILGVELEYQYGMCLLLLGGRLAEVRRWLGKAAMEGHAEAACAMGQLFDAGNPLSGVSPGLTISSAGGAKPEAKDTSAEDLEAVNWWQMAAKHGSLVAMDQLGSCFLSGRGGLRRDRTEAIKWFRRSAAGGVADALNHMGKAMQEGGRGKGEREDIAAAVPWYRQAAERGHVEAMRNLGVCYLKEEQDEARQLKDTSTQPNGQYAPSKRVEVPSRPTRDYTFGDSISAHGWLVRAAELGDIEAMLLVAQCWAKGEGGVEKDPETAVKWFRRAAEAGSILAAAELGTCLHKGSGIYQDPHEAVHWLQVALYGGHLGVGYLLGLYHMGGIGREAEWEARLGVLEHDIPKGVSLLVAAAQGNYGDVTRDACLALARVYTDGAYRKEAKQGGVAHWLGESTSLLGRRDTPLADVPPKPEEAFKWRLKAAELGDPESQYTVGSTYLKGTQWLPRDGSTALLWLWKAADQGLANAQFLLGCCLLEGVGLDGPNESLAMAWFDKAAAQGHGEAIYSMGKVLLAKVEAMTVPDNVGGLPVPTKRAPSRAYGDNGSPTGDERQQLGQEALQLLRRAAAKDVADASFKLGCLYEDGLDGVVDKDPLAAVQWYWKASREGINGSVDAYCKLGLCYLKGMGVDKDDSQARDWLELAVESGHAEASYVLGKLLQPGASSLEEKERVFLLFKQAVDKGYVKDILSLARCYVEGQGVPVNKQKGVELLRDAAAGGNPAAMNQLAMCFESGGAGLTKDVKKASYWWALSSEQGDAIACYRVGRALLDNEWGDEICESLGGYERAVHSLHEAASHGHVEALYRLGKDMLDKADKPVAGEVPPVSPAEVEARAAARLEREKKAVEVLKTASSLGSKDATAQLGFVYERGGVGGEARDEKHAVQLYIEATEGVDDERVNAEALMRLALHFQEGRGVERDDENAWRLLNRAAGLQHPEALFHVGQALQVVDATADEATLEEARQGKAMVERSCELGFLPAMAVVGRELWREHAGGSNLAAAEKAMSLIKEAAKGGIVEAIVELAAIFETGAPGYAVDLRLSFQLWKQAADAGHVKGYLKSAIFVLESKGGAEQLASASEAYGWLERAVAAYDVEAMHTLAYYYLTDAKSMRDMFERERKEVQAIKLLETAVAADHPPAIVALADIFLQGNIAGQEVDEAAAAALLVRVTPGPSFGDSRLRLAKLFMAGRGVEEDRVKGWQLYMEAAEAGSVEACYVVALSLDRDLVDDAPGNGPPTTASTKACLLLPSGKGVQPTPEEQEQAFELLEFSAGAHYAPAKSMLGRWLWRGNARKSDPARGLTLMRQAAQAGDLDGMVDLAHCYEVGGPSLRPDAESSLAWLKKASDAGHAHSMYQLAQAILDGKPGAHKYGDASTALALVQQAAGLNHAAALLQLCYVTFNDAEKIEDVLQREAMEFQALTLLERSARYKNPQAIFDLAEIKRKGGVGGQLADPFEAARLLHDLLQSATDYRRGEARVRLASMYEEGLGVPRDEGKALELYTVAADHDRHAHACYVIGSKLARGTRVPGIFPPPPPPPPGGGISRTGSGGAMGMVRSASGSVGGGLSRAASMGTGVDKQANGVPAASGNSAGYSDEELMQQRAFEFFQEAAQQGYRPAKATLGRCYWEGKGVAQDTVKGLKLVQEAALDGECGAMVTLARWHEEGTMGVVSDIRRAMSWWKLAAEEGDAHAQHKVGRFILEKVPGSEELGDVQVAITWLQKAVDQGHLQAKHWLGLGQLLPLGWSTEDGTWAPIQPDASALAEGGSEGKPAEAVTLISSASSASSSGGAISGLAAWGLFGSKPKEPERDASIGAAFERERLRLQALIAARVEATAAPMELIESAARSGYEPAVVEMAKLCFAREQLLGKTTAGAHDKDGRAGSGAAAKAAEWLRHVALRDPRPGFESFNADAKFRLAELCAKGLGVPQDEGKALELYFAAASMGHVAACLKVGTLMASGQVRSVADDGGAGGEAGGVDEEGAFAMFRAAADNGSQEGKVEVARRLWAGRGVAQDPPAAIALLRPLASTSFPEAQRELAACLLEGGPGVKASPSDARDWLAKAAAAGDAPAQLRLGVILLSEPDEVELSAGGKRNAEAGLALLHSAAKADLPAAQVEMGKCLELGLCNKPSDIRAALPWYMLAAEKGDWDGMVALGNAYLRLARERTRGVGTEAKRGEAMDEGLSWLRKAATLGCIEAVYQLGIVAESGADSGLPIKRNMAKAVELYLEAARGGHVKAQLALGMRYLQGGGDGSDGFPRKVSDGLRWLKQAAMVGNDADAQFQLGKLYSQGVPGELEKDPAIAVQWLRRSANQDHAPAQNGLGEAYQTGMVVIQDDVSAVTWFRRAAEKEYPPALLNLARCLEAGRGCKTDFMAFLRCLETAAELEYPQAQYEYAMCHRLGKGMKKDVAKAMDLLSKAAATGHVSAMHQLGLCLKSGEGLPAPQLEQAKDWLMRAAAGGSVQAQSALDEIIADQIREAKQKANKSWL